MSNKPAAISQIDPSALTRSIVLATWERRPGCVINGHVIMQSSVVREHAGIPDNENLMICIAMRYPDDSFVALSTANRE